jgi:hypothetical protein
LRTTRSSGDLNGSFKTPRTMLPWIGQSDKIIAARLSGQQLQRARLICFWPSGKPNFSRRLVDLRKTRDLTIPDHSEIRT